MKTLAVTEQGEASDSIGSGVESGDLLPPATSEERYGIDVSPPTSHDPRHYSPEVLREMADRIEQLKDAPMWIRWLASEGGAHLS